MEREVSEVDRKLLLKKNYLDKIRYYITRNPINQDELYFLVRKFFTEYLKLDYEFTYEELSQELNKVFIKPKVKEHIDMFLIRLSESEYLEETVLGTADINSYLRELDDIIRNMIFDDQPVVEESPTLMQKVLKRKSSEQDKLMDLTGASALIDEINYHISNANVDTAKTSYVELSKLYDKLDKDDKKKIHDAMNEVYERLQSLVKNPKYVMPTIKQTINESVSESLKSIKNLVEETQFYINASNIDSAKRSYSVALQEYESLNVEDKKSMHSKVNELYNQLQALTSRPASPTGITAPTLSTKDLSEDNESILSMDLPPLEPIPNVDTHSESTSRASVTSANSSKFSASTVSTSTSKIPTANFVEDFGKAVASSSTVPDNMMIETKPSSASANSSNVPFDFSAPMDSDINDITAESVTFQANGPITDEIDFDKLAPASDAPNMLFTVNSSDEIRMSAATKPVVQQKKTISSTPVSTVSKSDLTSDVKSRVVPDITVATKKEVKPEATTILETNSLQKDNISTIPNTLDIPDTVPDFLEAQKPSTADYTTSASPLSTSKSTLVFTPDSPLGKLDMLLKKIDDDIIMDKLDKGKETYKDALMIYRSLRDSDKTFCYEHFFNTFKKLDDALHQKSLHSILDEQLLDSTKSPSNRPVVSTKPLVSEKLERYVPESSTIVNSTTLPIIIDGTPETTRVYELIEESYFNIENHNADLAMLKYFKAVEFYRKLPVNDKRKAYADLYRLFQKLAVVKKVRYH